VVRYEIFHDVLARAILHWRRTYLSQIEREERTREAIAKQRQYLRRIATRVAYLVLVLAVGGAGIMAWRYQRAATAEQQAAQTARALLAEARAAAAKAEETERQARRAAEEASNKQAQLLTETQRPCEASSNDAQRELELARLKRELHNALERADRANKAARLSQAKANDLRVQVAAAVGEDPAEIVYKK
jgi:hypothetical protein